MHQGAGAASRPPLRTTPHDRERTSGRRLTVLPTAPNSEEVDGNHECRHETPRHSQPTAAHSGALIEQR